MTRNLYIVLAVGAIAAAGLVSAWKPTSPEAGLIKDQAEKAMPAFAGTIKHEPIAVDIVLLHYAQQKNKVSLYEAQVALLKYPSIAAKVLPVYGESPQFEEILNDYGSSVFLPVYYFMENDVKTVDAMYYSGSALKLAKGELREVNAKLRRFVSFGKAKTDTRPVSPLQQEAQRRRAVAGKDTSAGSSLREKPDSTPSAVRLTQNRTSPPPLTSALRGWFAINFVHQGGREFLSQFALASNGQVTWIQTKRVLDDLTGFVVEPVTRLDTKIQTGVEVTPSDVGWAAAAVIGAVDGTGELVGIGRAAGRAVEAGEDTARSTIAAEDTQGVSSETDRAIGAAADAKATTTATDGAGHRGVVGRLFRRAVEVSGVTGKAMKFGGLALVAASVWMLCTHPLIFLSFMGSMLVDFAHAVGWPAWLVEFSGYFILLVPIMYVLSLTLKYLIKPTIFALDTITTVLGALNRALVR